MGGWAGRRDFFPSPPLKSVISYNYPGLVIDSPQLSGSINVQDGGIALFPPPAPPQKKMDCAAKYACFTG